MSVGARQLASAAVCCCLLQLTPSPSCTYIPIYPVAARRLYTPRSRSPRPNNVQQTRHNKTQNTRQS